MFKNDFEDTPFTPPLTIPEALPSSSVIASSPVSPVRPVTPQPEDSDEEIGCHPKLSRTHNLGTNVSDNGLIPTDIY
jgi:hypothetical protein